MCIHGTSDKTFHGLNTVQNICYMPYFSGWTPYCATCGRMLFSYGFLHYMSKESASTLDAYNMDKDYFYRCPYNGHLEQGFTPGTHACDAISYNRYKVVYKENGTSVTGRMNPSIHMYNNATEYEGVSVTPSRKLTVCAYVREGYEFAYWSTRPDGTGTRYTDGQEIYNLTAENYDGKDESKGVITLYAQWKKKTSSLVIDANGGTYRDDKGTVNTATHKTTFSNMPYGTSYTLDKKKLTPPKGYKVSFDTSGGNPIDPVTATKELLSWKKIEPFKGRLTGDTYYFLAANGATDTIQALYKDGSIILPTPVRDGYNFGGWFEDAELTKPAGFGGDSYTPSGDKTLYAYWSGLVLWSTTDLSVDNGKGGVDLKWRQPDSTDKSYKLFQKQANYIKWQQILEAEDVGTQLSVSERYDYTGTGKTFTVPFSGFYTLEAGGAQGRGCNRSDGNGVYEGGRGGRVTMTVWLVQGDRLTFKVGGSNGYNGGAAGQSGLGANGGGMTVVVSEKRGTLLIAGGGGGASIYNDGEAGGASTSLVPYVDNNGSTGAAGGGGGHRGGNGGEYICHNHQTEGCVSHYHSGNPTTGGGCYTTPDLCGGTSFTAKTQEVGSYRGDIDRNGNKVWCVICNPKDKCQGPLEWPNCQSWLVGNPHGVRKTTYVCDSCGKEYDSWTATCTAMSRYDLGCPYRNSPEGWQCGKSDKEVISCKPAYGGSNYVNTTVTTSYRNEIGVVRGEGYLKISSVYEGYLVALEKQDVPAHDKTPPYEIDGTKVVIKENGKDAVLVDWEDPEDRGTVYYHQAKSYKAGTDILISESNITMNTITTGVKEYYYIYDFREDTTVTKENRQGSVAESRLRVALEGGQNRYLHVAPVDAAGNIGWTTHIYIRGRYVNWGLLTDQIYISSVVGGKDFQNVWAKPDAEKTYYVKADGKTPFFLRFVGLINGSARRDYQVDNLLFGIKAPAGETQTFTTLVPHSGFFDEGDIPASTFVRSVSGAGIFADAMNTEASRERGVQYTRFAQAFSVSASYGGQSLVVTPTAGASCQEVEGYSYEPILYSDPAADSLNAITVIPDGEAPVVTGTEQLPSVTEAGRADGLVLTLKAQDALSGVREFSVIVQNNDNYVREVFTADADGKVVIPVDNSSFLFLGDVQFILEATDNVGNTYRESFGESVFDLEAEVNKTVPDGKTTFKRGEGATLDILTTGYVEKVEIIWPSEFASSLPDSFNYTACPEYAKAEKIPFLLPLTGTKEEYQIVVRAYKNGEVKEETVKICIEGSIFDDVRIRIR